MRKYLIVTSIIALLVTMSVFQVQSQTEENKYSNNNKNINIDQPIQPIRPTNSDILKVQQITGWPTEISEYFVSEANARGVKIFEEALPIVSIESGGTYRFDAIHINKNGSTDGGLFQLNDITYLGIVKQLKMEGKQFQSWDRLNPKFNIAAGMFWIAYLKDEYQLEGHQLFTCYNRGVEGGKKYASRNGSYKSEYSKKVYEVKNKLIK